MVSYLPKSCEVSQREKIVKGQNWMGEGKKDSSSGPGEEWGWQQRLPPHPEYRFIQYGTSHCAGPDSVRHVEAARVKNKGTTLSLKRTAVFLASWDTALAILAPLYSSTDIRIEL